MRVRACNCLRACKCQPYAASWARGAVPPPRASKYVNLTTNHSIEAFLLVIMVRHYLTYCTHLLPSGGGVEAAPSISTTMCACWRGLCVSIRAVLACVGGMPCLRTWPCCVAAAAIDVHAGRALYVWQRQRCAFPRPPTPAAARAPGRTARPSRTWWWWWWWGRQCGGGSTCTARAGAGGGWRWGRWAGPAGQRQGGPCEWWRHAPTWHGLGCRCPRGLGLQYVQHVFHNAAPSSAATRRLLVAYLRVARVSCAGLQ